MVEIRKSLSIPYLKPIQNGATVQIVSSNTVESFQISDGSFLHILQKIIYLGDSFYEIKEQCSSKMLRILYKITSLSCYQTHFASNAPRTRLERASNAPRTRLERVSNASRTRRNLLHNNLSSTFAAPVLPVASSCKLRHKDEMLF